MKIGPREGPKFFLSIILSQIRGMSFISSTPNRDNFHIFFSINQIFIIFYIFLIRFDFFKIANRILPTKFHYIRESIGKLMTFFFPGVSLTPPENFCHTFRIIEQRSFAVRFSSTLYPFCKSAFFKLVHFFGKFIFWISASFLSLSSGISKYSSGTFHSFSFSRQYFCVSQKNGGWGGMWNYIIVPHTPRPPKFITLFECINFGCSGGGLSFISSTPLAGTQFYL